MFENKMFSNFKFFFFLNSLYKYIGSFVIIFFLANDMLISITDQTSIPLPGMIHSYSTVFLLRDMAVALSSCIYQSLSDSDAINSKKFAAKDFATGAVLEAVSRLSVVYQDSSLVTSTNTRKMSYDGSLVEVTTDPPKWPGVTSLRGRFLK